MEVVRNGHLGYVSQMIMIVVVVDDSYIKQTDSHPKSGGLV